MKSGRALMMMSWITIFSLSCRKTIIDHGHFPSRPFVLTEIEKQRAHISKEVAAILEKVYQHADAYYEVNAAIYSRYYEDERVLLRDLLFPEKSGLYKTAIFKSFHAKEGVFRKRFNEAMDNGSFPYLEKELSGSPSKGTISSSGGAATAAINVEPAMPIFSNSTGVAIYFPYSENFSLQFTGMYRDSSGNFVKRQIATIVPTDKDANEGTGRESVDCGIGIGGPACFREVIVDDDYAVRRPTHIIGISAEPKAEVIKEPAAEQFIYRIYQGSSRLTQQLDHFISLTGNGGGSEIRIARISGYLKQKGQQVSDLSGDIITVHYTRGDIRKQKWRRIFSVWDPNWEADDHEQVYAVYEQDTEGVSKLKGSLTTTIGLPGKPSQGKVQGQVGFEVSVVTQDEIITQRKQDRYSYMRDAFSNQGWAYAKDPDDFLPANKDWPIFDGGAIWQYTWPFRIY